jgi:hypothetical protein
MFAAHQPAEVLKPLTFYSSQMSVAEEPAIN